MPFGKAKFKRFQNQDAKKRSKNSDTSPKQVMHQFDCARAMPMAKRDFGKFVIS